MYQSYHSSTARRMLTRLLNRKLAYFLLSFFLTAFTATSQTTLISPTVNNGGFESGTTGWTFVNATGTDANLWLSSNVDADPLEGTWAAYVSKGTPDKSYGYDVTVARTSHMYTDVTFPAGETNINLSFFWKGMGEQPYDKMMVYLAPTSLTPVDGSPASPSVAMSGATLLWEQPNYGQSSYTLASIPISASVAGNATASSSMRLIITWQNDATGGVATPAMIDNITLVTRCGTAQPTGATLLTGSKATVNWLSNSSATGYEIRYKKVTEGTSVATWTTPIVIASNTTTNYVLTGLSTQTDYEYQVRAVGITCNTFSFSSVFTTPCQAATLPLSEGFNSPGFNGCWNVTAVTTGHSVKPFFSLLTSGNNPSASPFEGTHMLRFNSSTASIGSQMRLVSAPVSSANLSGVDVEFEWYHDNTFGPSDIDGVQVQYSLDGVTWSNAGSFIARPNGLTTTAYWDHKKVTLPAAAAFKEVLYVGFLFSSYSGNNCFMDAVSIVPAPPTAPTANNSQQCGTGNATASVTSTTPATAPIFRWYTQAVGGTPIAGQSGNSLIAYSISSTTDFYVAEMNDNIEGARVKVTATVNPIPTATTTTTDATCYNGTNGTATAVPAGGTAPYTYSWNSTPVKTTKTATGLAANTYTVTVKDSKNCEVTAVATVGQGGIGTLPAFSLQPVNTTVCLNSNTTLTANATGLGTIVYQWQVNTGSGFTNVTNAGVYSGATTGTLTITGATAIMNGYKYRAIATGTCSPAATSNTATLAINYAPAITSQPGNADICPGNSVTITTAATGDNLVYQWQVNTGSGFTDLTNVAPYSNVNTPDMTITAVTAGMNGYQYRAVVTGSCGTPATTNAATLTTTGVVVFNTQPLSTVTCEGADATFTVETATTGYTYQWQEDAGSGFANLSDNSIFSGTNTNELMITGATTNMSGRLYRAIVTGGCSPTTSAVAALTVTPTANTSVSISANPGANICSGVLVAFTAAPVNGGTSPSYQWKLNGTNVGTNSNIYTSSTLGHNDVVAVEMTSNVACPSDAVTASNDIVMNVTPTHTPTVTIGIPSTSICAGAAAMFVANAVHGGTNPSYQWKLNGFNVGINNANYVNSNLANGDIVSVDVTSNYSCLTTPVATKSVSMTVNPLVTATISISSSTGVGACTGVPTTFTATATNTGSTPVYTWKKNGAIVGSNSATWNAGTTLVNGDLVTCELSSSVACASPSVVTSNAIAMIGSSPVTPAVTINAPGIICDNATASFTAVATNGGSNPTYVWKKNGSAVGGNTNTFTDNGLVTGDLITVELTSNALCATSTSANNSFNVTVTPQVLPAVSVMASPGASVCQGEIINFTAAYNNGGLAPAFQWTVNGSDIGGAILPTFSTVTLNDGDVVAVKMESSLSCAIPVASSGVPVTINAIKPTAATIVGIPAGNDIINFNSQVQNGGSNPSYQWRLNGKDIQGAYGATYTASGLGPNDIISLYVQTSEVCAMPANFTSNLLTVSRVTSVSTVAGSFEELALYPNPNNGVFTLHAKAAGTVKDRKVSIEVTNALGQQVYRSEAEMKNKELDTNITISNASAGMYMLHIVADGERKTIRFVVK